MITTIKSYIMFPIKNHLCQQCTRWKIFKVVWMHFQDSFLEALSDTLVTPPVMELWGKIIGFMPSFCHLCHQLSVIPRSFCYSVETGKICRKEQQVKYLTGSRNTGNHLYKVQTCSSFFFWDILSKVHLCKRISSLFGLTIFAITITTITNITSITITILLLTGN